MRERRAIEHVLLDLDNTLLDFGRAERRALTLTLEGFGLEPNAERVQLYSAINLEHWRRLERGEISRERLKVERFQAFFATQAVEVEAAEAARIYEGHLGEGHYFMDGAEALLESLQGKHRLYLATNGLAHVQKGRIESAGIAPYFDGIFISELVGYNKPDRRFFEACFAEMEEGAQLSAAIVGDSLSSDIQGGLNAGIRTIWFNPGGVPNESEIRPDVEVGRLEEVPGYLH